MNTPTIPELLAQIPGAITLKRDMRGNWSMMEDSYIHDDAGTRHTLLQMLAGKIFK